MREACQRGSDVLAKLALQRTVPGYGAYRTVRHMPTKVRSLSVLG